MQPTDPGASSAEKSRDETMRQTANAALAQRLFKAVALYGCPPQPAERDALLILHGQPLGGSPGGHVCLPVAERLAPEGIRVSPTRQDLALLADTQSRPNADFLACLMRTMRAKKPDMRLVVHVSLRALLRVLDYNQRTGLPPLHDDRFRPECCGFIDRYQVRCYSIGRQWPPRPTNDENILQVIHEIR